MASGRPRTTRPTLVRRISCLRSAAHTLTPGLATTGTSHSKNNNVCNTLLNLDDTLGSTAPQSGATPPFRCSENAAHNTRSYCGPRICCCLRSFTQGRPRSASGSLPERPGAPLFLAFQLIAVRTRLHQELCTDQAKPCCHIGCRCALSLGSLVCGLCLQLCRRWT